MPRNQATYPLSRHLPAASLAHWFSRQGFQSVAFQNGKFETSVDVGAQPIFHKLTERPGYQTYYREAKGGAILVFEVQAQETRLLVEAYAPMMVFGMVRKELAFKPKGGLLTPYLTEGYQVWEGLREYASGLR